jgi:hypothetical protein
MTKARVESVNDSPNVQIQKLVPDLLLLREVLINACFMVKICDDNYSTHSTAGLSVLVSQTFSTWSSCQSPPGTRGPVKHQLAAMLDLAELYQLA